MQHCWDPDLLWSLQMRSLTCQAARPPASGLEQLGCPARQRRARQRRLDQPPQQAQMRRQPFQVSCIIVFLQGFAQRAPFSSMLACDASKQMPSLNTAKAQPPLHILQMRRAGTRLCCASCRLLLRGLMLLTWHPRVSHSWKCTCLWSFRGPLCLLHMPGLAQLHLAEDSAAPKRCCLHIA